MLVELSDKVGPLDVNGEVGCLMARTLQLKLLPMFLWAIANLFHKS